MKIFEWLAEMRYRNSSMYQVGMVHIILGIICLLGLVIDPREVGGINPWIKPIKFGLSNGIFLLTAGWFLFELQMTNMKWVKILTWTFVISFTIETIIILLQAARGVPSHFNFNTLLDGILFGIMGLFVTAITIATVIMLILFLRQKSSNPVHLFSVRAGLFISLLGSMIGGVMIKNMQHSVGIVDGGDGLLFLNWSTVGGDLRVGHFLGLHAFQLIPVFAYTLKTRTNLSQRNRFFIVGIFTVIYASLVSLLYSQAAQGVPLISRL